MALVSRLDMAVTVGRYGRILGHIPFMEEYLAEVPQTTGSRCLMAKPFNELWKAMEKWRRRVESGGPPGSYRLEPACRSERRFVGCPDEEALCGWVDGQLYRSNPRRWLRVWLHVRIRRCQKCLTGIMALQSAITSGSEVEDPDRHSPQ
jgi:hypothetical protein